MRSAALRVAVAGEVALGLLGRPVAREVGPLGVVEGGRGGPHRELGDLVLFHAGLRGHAPVLVPLVLRVRELGGAQDRLSWIAGEP